MYSHCTIIRRKGLAMAFIKKLTDNMVKARVHLGYTSDGKIVQRQKTLYRPSNVSKARWLKSYHLTVVNTWENEVKSAAITTKDIKLDAFVKLWEKEHATAHLAPKTLVSYKDNLRLHILPRMGHLYLSDITTVHVQKMINDLTERGLARRTVNYPKQILSSILSQAIKWGYISDNPCKKAAVPQIPQEKKKKYYELDEISKLMELVKGEMLKYQVIFYLALSGGLRRSELINLRIQDVESHGIHVNRAKNDSSVRFVSLDDATMALIRLHIGEQERLGHSLGWTEDWLFTQKSGKRMADRTPTAWLKKVCDRNNIDWAGLHGLRHTSVTLLISSGVDIRTVSGRVGHKHTSTTINIYAHMLRDKEQASAHLIGDVLHRVEKNALYMHSEPKIDKKSEKIKKTKSL